MRAGAWRCWSVGLLAAASLGAVAPAAGATAPATRPVLVVGNNWDGTASIVDPHAFRVLRTVNVVPDLAQRMNEIETNPVRLGYFLAIRQQIGEGHDQLVDDSFTSHDGRLLYVSRPSLADVVAIDIATDRIVWRTPVDGYRSDHMAISPDGTRLVVSASTANVVDVLDTATGRKVGSFPSGDSPHENNFSKDGRLIFHASIGRVYTPQQDPPFGATKGDRWFEVVDARTLQVLKRFDMGQKLAQDGYPGFSSAVRPMAISPDEKTFYLQLSFFHGFVVYDLAHDHIVRVVRLPVSDADRNTPPEQYVLNSAHHGIAINPSGRTLCVAGTMDNYIAMVSTRTFRYRIINSGERPYWSSTSSDGQFCFVSIAGADEIDAVDYATQQRVAQIHVGDHPQRTRMGRVLTSILGPAGRVTLPVRVRSARLRAHSARVRLATPVDVTALRVRLRRHGRTFAAGRLAHIVGRHTLRLRSRRTLRPGAYRLVLRGTLADGTAGAARFGAVRPRASARTHRAARPG
jgi:DNA-binding beta-propeller fold protein YncE